MAILSLFCISEEMSGYSVAVERKIQDIHGTVYLIKASDPQSGELIVAAVVRSVEGPAPAGQEDRCSLFEVRIPDCEYRSSTLAYEQLLRGEDREPRSRGVRQDIVFKKGTLGAATNVVLPCQIATTGALRCGASLPRCEIEPGSAGCR
jgi:hypothetical protein